MLPKLYRLTAKKDFSRLFGKGRPVHHRLLILKTVKNGLDHGRVGFVVSTKVAKHAVDRNRTKRRMRSVVRKHLDRLVPGQDAVLIAKKDAVRSRFDEFEQAVVHTMEKAGVLASQPTRR